MKISANSSHPSPLTSPAYAARQREQAAKALHESEKKNLEAKPAATSDSIWMNPMMPMSALAMPLVDMKLSSAIQIGLERSIYEIDMDL